MSILHHRSGRSAVHIRTSQKIKDFLISARCQFPAVWPDRTSEFGRPSSPPTESARTGPFHWTALPRVTQSRAWHLYVFSSGGDVVPSTRMQ